MKDIKIGVVGAGIYGSFHIRAFACDQHVSRVVFCDLDERRRAAAQEAYGIAGYASVAEMIEAEELDAVSIATSDPYHFEPARDAIEGGVKHLLIEKPLATTVRACETLSELAKSNGASICIDFHKRWDPAYICMRDEIKRGGDAILRGYMSLDDVISVPRSWFSWSAKSSPAWFLGVHCYDLIRYMTDSEAVRVYASGSKTVLRGTGIDTWDSLSAMITMGDDSTWTVETSWVLPDTFPKSNDGQLVMLTDRSYLKNESYRGLKMYTDTCESLPNYLFMNFAEKSATGFGLEPMHEFASAVAHGRAFKTSAFDGLQATRIAQAVHESAESGRTVTL